MAAGTFLLQGGWPPAWGWGQDGKQDQNGDKRSPSSSPEGKRCVAHHEEPTVV